MSRPLCNQYRLSQLLQSSLSDDFTTSRKSTEGTCLSDHLLFTGKIENGDRRYTQSRRMREKWRRREMSYVGDNKVDKADILRKLLKGTN